MELRSADPTANPYLTFALMIYAALDGMEQQLPLPEPCDINLYKADAQFLSRFERLPASLSAACSVAAGSAFIRAHVPKRVLDIYCNR